MSLAEQGPIRGAGQPPLITVLPGRSASNRTPSSHVATSYVDEHWRSRSARLDVACRRLDELRNRPLDVSQLDHVFNTMGLVAWAIDSCSEEQGGLTSPHTDAALHDAHAAFTATSDWLTQRLQDSDVLGAITDLLQTAAAAVLGGVLDPTPVVWVYDAGGPSSALTRPLQILLTSHQLGTPHDLTIARHTYVDPATVRYQLLVRTEAWVHELVSVAIPPHTRYTAAPLDDVAIDYLCGIWTGSSTPPQFSRATTAAARLAADHARRRADTGMFVPGGASS